MLRGLVTLGMAWLFTTVSAGARGNIDYHVEKWGHEHDYEFGDTRPSPEHPRAWELSPGDTEEGKIGYYIHAPCWGHSINSLILGIEYKCTSWNGDGPQIKIWDHEDHSFLSSANLGSIEDWDTLYWYPPGDPNRFAPEGFEFHIQIYAEDDWVPFFGDDVHVKKISVDWKVDETPPDKPTTPQESNGEIWGYPGLSYAFQATATDPDGDRIFYVFDWGDGNKDTTWDYQSGQEATMYHTWHEEGEYEVRVQAMDECFKQLSQWSDVLIFVIREIPPYEIELTPVIAWFTAVRIGECSSETTWFSLTSVGTLTATGIVRITSEFRITEGAGEFSLDPGDTLRIGVQFCPESWAFRHGTLLADGTNCNDETSSLIGWGALFDIQEVIAQQTFQDSQNNQGSQSNPCSLWAVPGVTEEPHTDQATEVTPNSFVLFQNYPNPFNPDCEIRYALTRDAEVNLSVYNLLGQKVKTLVDEFQAAGHKVVHWDGTDEEGGQVASGVYFYRLEGGGFTAAKKMILLR